MQRNRSDAEKKTRKNEENERQNWMNEKITGRDLRLRGTNPFVIFASFAFQSVFSASPEFSVASAFNSEGVGS
jgi:hypothetical protein